MGSVAYRSQPQLPGWIDATLSLVVGWFLSALAILVLYGAARFVGAISQPYAWHAGVVNEWPYPDNGLWSLLANVAVILIALLLTTVATSWWLRRNHARLSDGRLAVVLLFAGWIPLKTAGPAGGLVGFLIALVLIRHWVARHEDHLAPPKAAALVSVLGIVVLAYGLLHPLWTAGVFPTTSAGKQRSVLVDVRSAARVVVTIDRIEAPPAFSSPGREARLHLAPGAHGAIVLSVPRGCGTAEFGIHTRYHIFGLALSETLPARVRLGHGC